MIPRKNTPKSTPPAARPTRRILYVDDDPENRLAMKLNLGDDFLIVFAETDVRACAVVVSGVPLDAILLDIELKGCQMDGMALAAALRGRTPRESLPAYARALPVVDTPIIFVTAFGESIPTSALEQTGANMLVQKPVNFTHLTLALAQVRLSKLRAGFTRL